MFVRKSVHDGLMTYAQSLLNDALEKIRTYGGTIEGMSAEIVGISAERDMAKADVLALAAERDGLIDTLREVQTILSKVPEYDGMGALPVVTATQMLVNDHSELEARIEAVLTIESYAGRDVPNWEAHYVPADEVHRLLRGGQRVPDTIEGIES